ncbi:IMPACT family protein [Bacteroidales bacterium OttesenSCG-928-B11]|nr:IMPACT family protein [Bacteroidales bacterium OttesenSCG-928-E04]MDL2308800.1 IMPACT family protein [Bacteroidales bacterium OttesenSCG-928-C03]MDL2312078.1 IMPACT family protein [Bacteroidales bacterium OttesenSCG-928-B11]MDL2325688.1 IMPACT family protein [Bacteroidales bacterium OttesenSCG-928-A14]
MFDDTYKTIAKISTGIYTEKGSKFLAFAYPVKTESEIKEIVGNCKKEYYDARHHCYAYILGADQAAYRINDDGEPSGTAGRPIYGQLLSNGITDVLVIVVRYFGGTKLGVPGLINAYKTAAAEAIQANEIVEKYVEEYYRIAFDYAGMNSVMQILKNTAVKILSQGYEEDSIIDFKVRKREADQVLDALRKIRNTPVKITVK